MRRRSDELIQPLLLKTLRGFEPVALLPHQLKTSGLKQRPTGLIAFRNIAIQLMQAQHLKGIGTKQIQGSSGHALPPPIGMQHNAHTGTSRSEEHTSELQSRPHL